MFRTIRLLGVLAVAGTIGLSAADAEAQAARGTAGGDLITVGVYGGGLSPTSDLSATSGFDNSGTVGATVTLWVHPVVGLRGNGLFARTSVGSGAPEDLLGERPNVWAYSGDLVLRLPMAAPNGRDTWFPYLVGGAGGKTYDFDTLGTETDFAGSFGAGIEYRFAQWGIQAEVRDIVTSFERFGVDETQHDVVWTAGITWSH